MFFSFWEGKFFRRPIFRARLRGFASHSAPDWRIGRAIFPIFPGLSKTLNVFIVIARLPILSTTAVKISSSLKGLICWHTKNRESYISHGVSQVYLEPIFKDFVLKGRSETLLAGLNLDLVVVVELFWWIQE